MSDELRQTRIEKAEQLKQLGINPYAYKWESTHRAADLQEKFASLPKGEEDLTEVAIAGRIMTRRVMGKLAFFTLQDETGSIQLYLEKKRIQENMSEDAFKQLDKLVDAGDFMGVTGTLRRTDKGELSVYVKEYTNGMG
jgi:lysyl-tRNA synthetase, class II